LFLVVYIFIIIYINMSITFIYPAWNSLFSEIWDLSLNNCLKYQLLYIWILLSFLSHSFKLFLFVILIRWLLAIFLIPSYFSFHCLCCILNNFFVFMYKCIYYIYIIHTLSSSVFYFSWLFS
jgi:hypothetical protein